MPRHLIAAALAATMIALPAAAQAPAAWAGHYRYAWNGGRTAGGSGVVITYDLHLTRDACRITARGFQTDETIRCTVAPNGKVIDIRFASFGDGRTVNKYGVARYKTGERLFLLSNRRGTIWTGWGSYAPWENKQPLGRHFRRVR